MGSGPSIHCPIGTALNTPHRHWTMPGHGCNCLMKQLKLQETLRTVKTKTAQTTTPRPLSNGRVKNSRRASSSPLPLVLAALWPSVSQSSSCLGEEQPTSAFTPGEHCRADPTMSSSKTTSPAPWRPVPTLMISKLGGPVGNEVKLLTKLAADQQNMQQTAWSLTSLASTSTFRANQTSYFLETLLNSTAARRHCDRGMSSFLILNLARSSPRILFVATLHLR
jgi:hypothetical protein